MSYREREVDLCTLFDQLIALFLGSLDSLDRRLLIKWHAPEHMSMIIFHSLPLISKTLALWHFDMLTQFEFRDFSKAEKK